MQEQWSGRLGKTARTFFNLLPIVIGMLLLTSLVLTLYPAHLAAELFGGSAPLDAVIGASAGSVVAGHPLVSYVLGGELLQGGVSLVAVTAFIVSWVTVGVVQFPAEALMLGGRFALYRNLLSFFSAILVAYLVVYTLQFIGQG